MNLLRNISIYIIILISTVQTSHSFTGPNSFSDLAERLSPSVVNISTTGTVKTNQNSQPSLEDFFNLHTCPPNLIVPPKSESLFLFCFLPEISFHSVIKAITGCLVF